MKLQLNTTAKTITLDEAVNIGDLIIILEKLLPGEWKTYKIEVKLITNWSNPIIIKEYPTWPYQPYWWNTPLYDTYDTTDGNTFISNLGSSSGTFNLDLSN